MTPPTQRSAGRAGPAVVALVVLLSVAGGTVGGVTVADPGGEQSLDGVQASSHTGLTVDPSTTSFGTVAPGGRETATVTVANTASEPVEVGSIEFTGDTDAFSLQRPEAIEQAQQLDRPIPVPAGSSEQGTLVFEPDAPGSYSATLTVRAPDGEALVSATATGTAAAGEIEASTQSLTFTGTTVGSTATRSVTVSNNGTGALSVASAIEGSDSYSVRDGRSLALQPGESGRVTVAFSPDSTASETALLELRSGDPDQPVLPVTLSDANTQTAISTTQRGTDRKVNISVRNVNAGETVDVPVPSSADETESVDIDSISVTPSRDTNLSLNVTDSEDPLETTPDTELGDNATGLRYLNVTHSVPNADIEEVKYTFRMRKDRVANITAPPNETAAANPDAVTMYRYNETAGWTEQNTTRVRTTDTHYHYVTTGDGFSEWTTAAKRPDIRVADATASVDAARVGETVDIQVSLQNNGGADGVFVTELLLNGTVVDDRRATVPDGGTVGVTFERPFDQPGNYEVRVNDVSVGTIDVSDEGVKQRTATPSQPDDGGDDDTSSTDSAGGSGLSMPVLFGAGAVVLVGVLGGLLYARGGEEPAAETGSSNPGDDSVIQTEGFGDEGTEDAPADDGGPPGGTDATAGEGDTNPDGTDDT